jgi:hypothetical protein
VIILLATSDWPSVWGWKAELGAGEPEQFLPQHAGEHRVAVADDGLWQAVEPENGVEKCLGERHRRVRVVEGDEVGIFQKSVHHRQDDRIAADLGKTFDEVKHNVAPYAGWYCQWLQEAGRMKVSCLVALAQRAAMDEVTNQAVVARREEGGA